MENTMISGEIQSHWLHEHVESLRNNESLSNNDGPTGIYEHIASIALSDGVRGIKLLAESNRIQSVNATIGLRFNRCPLPQPCPLPMHVSMHRGPTRQGGASASSGQLLYPGTT